MEKSIVIASIIAIACLFFCSFLAISELFTWTDYKVKKYVLCGYAYGYTDTSPPWEVLNQTELVNRCKDI